MYLGCAGFEQHASTLGQRGAGGHDVVHKQDASTLGPLWPRHCESSSHDSAAGGRRLPSQSRRIANSAQAVGNHQCSSRWPARELLGDTQEFQSLIESSLAQTPGMQRDRAQGIHAVFNRIGDGGRKQSTQGPCEVSTPSMFQVENGLCGGAPVGQHGPNPRERQRARLTAVTARASAAVIIGMGKAAAVTGLFHCLHGKFATLAKRTVLRHKGVAGSATSGPEKLSSKPKEHTLLSAAAGSGLRPVGKAVATLASCRARR